MKLGRALVIEHLLRDMKCFAMNLKCLLQVRKFLAIDKCSNQTLEERLNITRKISENIKLIIQRRQLKRFQDKVVEPFRMSWKLELPISNFDLWRKSEDDYACNALLTQS